MPHAPRAFLVKRYSIILHCTFALQIFFPSGAYGQVTYQIPVKSKVDTHLTPTAMVVMDHQSPRSWFVAGVVPMKNIESQNLSGMRPAPP
ncbi:hypothetical protein C8J41_1257 [Sphingomonas sp. PP-CC-3G-468]|nr:hypothetical protein C8J41_1257 [Sphingomonas sp. PP-CC-3G-468]